MRSPVAKLILVVAAVVAALILCVHFFEGPDGAASVSLAELWWCAFAVLGAGVIEAVERRAGRRP